MRRAINAKTIDLRRYELRADAQHRLNPLQLLSALLLGIDPASGFTTSGVEARWHANRRKPPPTLATAKQQIHRFAHHTDSKPRSLWRALAMSAVRDDEPSRALAADGTNKARTTLLVPREDRYGGVEVDVPEAVDGAAVAAFEADLRQGLAEWQAAGKGGVWLKVPLSSASCVGVAARLGFVFHHAKQEYVLLTRWLKDTPSPLPQYGFTQIGVGGVVVNSRSEVLMVQERVSPLPKFQGSWKLPGGLADPGEHFAETVAREVQEETGITGTLEGLVSLRHSHGFRFGQGDLYVVVKLRATNEDIALSEELLRAEWMSREKIKSLVAEVGEPLDQKVTPNNWAIISNALDGALIRGTEQPNSRGGRNSLFYTAAAAPP